MIAARSRTLSQAREERHRGPVEATTVLGLGPVQDGGHESCQPLFVVLAAENPR